MVSTGLKPMGDCVKGSGDVPQDELGPMLELELDDADGELVLVAPLLYWPTLTLERDALETVAPVRGGLKTPENLERSSFSCPSALFCACEDVAGLTPSVRFSAEAVLPLSLRSGTWDGNDVERCGDFALLADGGGVGPGKVPNLGNSKWKFTSLRLLMIEWPKGWPAGWADVRLDIMLRRFLYSLSSTVTFSSLARRTLFSWFAASDDFSSS